MVLIGRHLLPEREGAQAQRDVQRLREYVTEVRVSTTSPLAGQMLVESRLGQDYDVTVLAIERDGVSLAPIGRDTRVQTGDLLTVESSAVDLVAGRAPLGLTIEAEPRLDPRAIASKSLTATNFTAKTRRTQSFGKNGCKAELICGLYSQFLNSTWLLPLFSLRFLRPLR